MNRITKIITTFLISINFSLAFIIIADLFELLPISTIINVRYIYILSIALLILLLIVLILARMIRNNKQKCFSFIKISFYILFSIQLLILCLVNSGFYFILFKNISVNIGIYFILLLTYLFTIFSFLTFLTKRYCKDEKKPKYLAFNNKNPTLHNLGEYLSTKKDLLYLFAFLSILLIAGFIYLNNIGRYPFQMDEIFHGGIVKTFAEENSLFYIDERYYGRSKITSLLGIISYILFSKLDINSSLELITRVPIAIIAIINIALTQLIIKKASGSKLLALLAGILVATETYIYYFATYFRFYTISIFFILFLIYLLFLKPKSLFIPTIAVIVSILSYFLLSEMFLLIMLFFTVILFLRILNSQIHLKYKRIFLFSILIISLLSIAYAFISRFLSNSNYNMVNWNLNLTNILYYIKWLTLNYGLYIGLFLSYLPLSLLSFFKNPKLSKQHILELYMISILLFFFLYMLNVPFNFTFRPNLFIIPILIATSTVYLSKILNRKLLIITIALIIASNTYSSVQYSLHNPGDDYHPTKLVYEKIDILTGSKDISEFLNNFLSKEDKKKFQIGYLGLGTGHIRHYLEKDFDNTLNRGFTNTSESSPTIEDLKDYLFSTDKKTLMIVSASSIPRHNILYEHILNRKYISESPELLSNFVIRHDEIFKEVYSSEDGISKVYLYDPAMLR